MLQKIITSDGPNGTGNSFPVVLKSVSGAEATYMDPTSTLAEPLTISVRVISKPLNSKAADRAQIRGTVIVRDSLGNPHACGCLIELIMPRVVEATPALMKKIAFGTMNHAQTGVVTDYTERAIIDDLIDGIIS